MADQGKLPRQLNGIFQGFWLVLTFEQELVLWPIQSSCFESLSLSIHDAYYQQEFHQAM